MTRTLHDLMHDAVRDAHPDLQALTTTSRRRGLSIRRRRQALAVVGSAATVAAIALGATQLGGGVSGGPAAGQPTLTPSVQPTPSPEPTAPAEPRVTATGRTVAAALLESVLSEQHGGADHFKGQGDGDSELYAQLDWHPWDASGTSVVGINVQPGFAETEIYECRGSQVRCSVTHPVRGTTLMTYEEHTATGGDHDGIRVVADLLRADGVRVVASSTNGFDLPSNQWDVTRPLPALDRRQLTEIVSLPTWGPEMDQRFATAGQRLRGYEEFPNVASVTPTS